MNSIHSSDTRGSFRDHAARGFSLIEVLLALAISAFSLLTILGVFTIGLQTTMESRLDTLTVNVMEQVKARMLTDPDWPIGATDAITYDNDTSFRTNLYYDSDGFITSQSAYVLRVEIIYLNPTNSDIQIGYRSERLDPMHIIFYNSRSDKPLISFGLNRAKKEIRPF